MQSLSIVFALLLVQYKPYFPTNAKISKEEEEEEKKKKEWKTKERMAESHTNMFK